tara:strand:- start:2863 stop:3054 length:192 start_codon:yes stop_codon:yes gene_type:complete
MRLQSLAKQKSENQGLPADTKKDAIMSGTMPQGFSDNSIDVKLEMKEELKNPVMSQTMSQGVS